MVTESVIVYAVLAILFLLAVMASFARPRAWMADSREPFQAEPQAKASEAEPLEVRKAA